MLRRRTSIPTGYGCAASTRTHQRGPAPDGVPRCCRRPDAAEEKITRKEDLDDRDGRSCSRCETTGREEPSTEIARHFRTVNYHNSGENWANRQDPERRGRRWPQ